MASLAQTKAQVMALELARVMDLALAVNRLDQRVCMHEIL